MNTIKRSQTLYLNSFLGAVLVAVLWLFSPTVLAWYWPSPTALTTDSVSFNQKIVGDGAGNAMAVWDDDDGVLLDGLLASDYTLGSGWGGPYVIVPEYDGFGPAASFDVAMNDHGDYIVASGAIHLSLGDRIVGDLFVGGTVISNNFLISTNLAPLATNPVKLRVALSGNGDALVVWDNGSELRYRMYRGGSWGADSMLEMASEIDSIDVAADESGNFTVVWKPSLSGEVYGRRFSGGLWSARETIGSGVAEYGPRVTMFGSGEALVAWQDPTTSPTRIRARRFSGTSWLTTTAVDAGTGFGSTRNPQIAAQPDGTAMVVFTQGTSASTERVYANRFSGGIWGSAEEISCGFRAHNLSVDLDGTGNAAAAMLASDTILYHAYADGLGWLGCSAQGVGGQSGTENILADRIGKRVVSNSHEIHTIFRSLAANSGPFAGRGNKDVYINGFDTETTDPVVALEVTLPFNDICGAISPFLFTEMRFSNNGVSWAPWESAPITDPYQVTRPGWDMTNPAYGGDAATGLKRVYIQYRNINCESLVTHDEIDYVPACVPDTEVCDGLDNDCDGSVDEDITDVVSGSDVGACQVEIQSCIGGEFQVTQPGIGPEPEVCDGVDNDCDAVVDDGIADITSGSDVGACQVEIQSCIGGEFQITQPGIEPAPEVCDGVDNDCDAVVDDGIADIVSGSDVGLCQPEVQSCIGGEFQVTQPGIDPVPEVCDGLDNNCDGTADDGLDTDADGDGHYTSNSCQSPADDCDDGNPDLWDCNTPVQPEPFTFDDPSGVTVTLPNVTSGGDSSIDVAVCTDPLPQGVGVTANALCATIQTSAEFTGQAEVCIPYEDDGTCSLTTALTCTSDAQCPAEETCFDPNESFLRMVRCPDGDPNNCEVLAKSSQDTVNNVYCGYTNHFSGFVVGQLLDTDNDFTPDLLDNCPNDANLFQTDSEVDAGGAPVPDGVGDVCDNCNAIPNADQLDTDADGYGNLCDGDLNNDGSTNTLDLNLYKQAHRTSVGDASYNVDADFNGDGVINTLDLNIYKGLHRKPPGPSCCGEF